MRNNIFLLLLISVIMCGCVSEEKVIISGQFFGAADRMVYLQEVVPGRQLTLDSAKCDSKGKFKFKVKVNMEHPSFLNVRMGNSFVPLLVEAGERIKIEAIGNIYVNYTVEGSSGSRLLRQLNSQTVATVQQLDSLSVLYDRETDTQRMQDIGVQYSKTYVSLKRDAITFIVKNSTSLAAVVPLYQPIFGNKFLFDSPSDIAYFRMVADSLSDRYPKSPHVLSLKSDIGRINDMYLRDSLLRVSRDGKAADFIDVKMKDSKGQVRTLSSLAGNVILLDFTSSQDVTLKSINRELVDLYNQYHKQGFEVFQVSLDVYKTQWINTVLGARLPWISVCDFMGGDSPAARSYNITKLPSNFLIDRQGNIVAKDIYGHDLSAAVAGLVK